MVDENTAAEMPSNQDLRTDMDCLKGGLKEQAGELADARAR